MGVDRIKRIRKKLGLRCKQKRKFKAMSERMTKNLVIQALFQSVSAKHPAKGLILHSDRGSQYCAHDYQKLLEQLGMTASMSRKGDCWETPRWKVFGERSKMS